MSSIPTLGMYTGSVPAILRALTACTTLVAKAKDFAAAKNIKDDVILNARLAFDMFPFVRQIQIVTDNAKGCAARLGGVEMPSYADTEQTFDELLARIEKTKAFVQSVPEAGFAGSEQKDIVLKFGPNEYPFNGFSYLTGFVLPNIYFHLTTAYDILRTNGVSLSKSDYLAG